MGDWGLTEVLPSEAKRVKRYEWIIWLGLKRTYSGFETVLKDVAFCVGQVLFINIFDQVSESICILLMEWLCTGGGKSPLRPLRTAKQRVDAACSSPSKKSSLSLRSADV